MRHQDIRENATIETLSHYYVESLITGRKTIYFFLQLLSFSKMDLYFISHMILQAIDRKLPIMSCYTEDLFLR